LKEKRVKYTKLYFRDNNTTVYSYFVPVTHIVDMTKSKLSIKYDIKDLNYVMYMITVVNTDYQHDDTIYKNSRWDDWSKSARPKRSKKSMVHVDLREQMRDYYDSLEDSEYVLYDDLNAPELD
jgi:hypothetical protein